MTCTFCGNRTKNIIDIDKCLVCKAFVCIQCLKDHNDLCKLDSIIEEDASGPCGGLSWPYGKKK